MSSTTVIIQAKEVESALDRLDDSGAEAERHTENSISVELDPSLGDHAETMKTGEVFVVTDAFGALIEGEIVGVNHD